MTELLVVSYHSFSGFDRPSRSDLYKSTVVAEAEPHTFPPTPL